MRTRLAFSLLMVVCLATLAFGADNQVKYLDCTLVPIPPETHAGSGYTALEVGLDGTVYIGTANYGFSAHLVAYDPKTGKMKDLASMHQVFHEHGAGINSQSKVHSELVVDSDGKIYGATKQGNEIFGTRPEYGEDREGYPGGHAFVYDPKTGETRDLGIGIPQEGLEAGAIDWKRRLIYFNSCPKAHLVVYDIITGQFSDKGQTNGSPRYNVVAGDGCLYQPVGGGRILKYDPVTDEVYDLEAGAGSYSFALGRDPMKIYGVGEYLLEFDVASAAGNKTIKVKRLCRSVPLGYTNQDTHTMITGQDGKVYWTAATRNDKTGESDLRLFRCDPNKRRREDLGIIRASNRPEVKIQGPGVVQGSAIGPDGTLYIKVIMNPYSLLIFPKLTAAR